MSCDKTIEKDGVCNVIEDGSLNKKEKGNPETDEVRSSNHC